MYGTFPLVPTLIPADWQPPCSVVVTQSYRGQLNKIHTSFRLQCSLSVPCCGGVVVSVTHGKAGAWPIAGCPLVHAPDFSRPLVPHHCGQFPEVDTEQGSGSGEYTSHLHARRFLEAIGTPSPLSRLPHMPRPRRKYAVFETHARAGVGVPQAGLLVGTLPELLDLRNLTTCSESVFGKLNETLPRLVQNPSCATSFRRRET